MPENPVMDKQQVLQILERLLMKLHERGDTSQSENLAFLYNTLKNPLFNHMLTLQQSIKQLKEQLTYLPPDRSVDFDFTRRGLLVFDADRHSLANGNLCVTYNSNNQVAPVTPKLGMDDFNMIIQRMAKISWGHIEEVELINDGSGLGFGIVGGKSVGVVVRTIVPGGLADKDGRLRTGDHILEIGKTNVQGMSSEQVAQVLRNCGNCVKMVVARDPTCEITVTPPTPAAQPVAALTFFQGGQLDTDNEIHEVQLTKKDGQSLGITIVGYSGISETGHPMDFHD